MNYRYSSSNRHNKPAWFRPCRELQSRLFLASQMSSRKFSFELFAWIVHDWARRTSIWCRIIGSTSVNRTVLLYGRIEDLLSGRDRKAANLSAKKRGCHLRKHKPVLPPNLSGSSGLCSNLGPERIDFFHNQLLHSFNRVLLFEPEVKFLFIDIGNSKNPFISQGENKYH
jgi:hypothetical protein